MQPVYIQYMSVTLAIYFVTLEMTRVAIPGKFQFHSAAEGTCRPLESMWQNMERNFQHCRSDAVSLSFMVLLPIISNFFSSLPKETHDLKSYKKKSNSFIGLLSEKKNAIANCVRTFVQLCTYIWCILGLFLQGCSDVLLYRRTVATFRPFDNRGKLSTLQVRFTVSPCFYSCLSSDFRLLDIFEAQKIEQSIKIYWIMQYAIILNKKLFIWG